MPRRERGKDLAGDYVANTKTRAARLAYRSAQKNAGSGDKSRAGV